tara:strand:+ start:802 stop:1296 length:495 start_codon:yes stop_codon:yes gene_type:complete
MNKLGFLVDNLGASQLGYYISKNVGSYLESNPQSHITCYYDNFEKRCAQTNFATMNIVEAWGQDGAMVATSINTAKKLLNFIGTQKKFFYLWDMTSCWARVGGIKHKIPFDMNSVFFEEDLTLICRNGIHAQIIENNFNREVKYTVDNFDIDKIMEIINNERTN